VNISLKVDDGAWQHFVAKLQYALGTTDTIFKKALQIIWPREIASHFDQEMGYEGAWAAWKSSTRSARIVHEIRTASTAGLKRASKAGVRPGGKLLQVSGRLRTEITQHPILSAISGGMKVESPTPYSGYLDEGTSKMVARPFMWLGEDAQDNLAKIFTDSLWGEAGGAD
jgi:phage gpG-like protein